MARHETLAWLLAPTEPGDFLRTIFERKHHHVRRDDATYFEDLFSAEQLDRYLTVGTMQTPDVALVRGGAPVAPEEFCYPSGLVDPHRLYEAYADGGTIAVMQLDRHVPALARLGSALEAELSYQVQANVYLTPPAAQGFRSHYDRHDVLVLQLEGSKRWRLFDTPVDLPHREQRFDASRAEETPPTAALEMKAGDVLYLPRGTMHEAESTDERSLHVTLGIIHPTWGDLLARAIERAPLREAKLRRALPAGFARPDFDRERAAEQFSELLAQAILGTRFDEAFDAFVEEAVERRRPFLLGQLAQVGKARALTVDTVVGPRPELQYVASVDGDQVVLSCQGRQMAMPASVEPLLAFALETSSYTIGELPVAIPDDAKIDFVRGLIRAGILHALDA